MATLGALEIQMYADLARLRQDMAQAKSIVGDAATSIQSTIKGVGTVFATLGVGLSVGAFTGWIRGAIDAADEASKLAQKTGVATDKIAGLTLAYQQAGAGGVEALQKSMSKLSSELVKGNDTLQAMGITTKDTREALGQIADKFEGMADGTAKAAAAVGIWGEKMGANMIPLLNAGSKGLEEMEAMARKLGLAISTETGQAAEKFNDTLELLGLASKGLATQAIAQLLPSMNAFAGALLESRTETERMERGVEVLATALKGLFSLVAGGAEILNVFGKGIGGAASAVAQLLGGGGREGASEALRASFDDIKQGIGSTSDMIKGVWTGSAAAVAEKSAEWAKQQRLAAQAADDLMRKMLAQSEAAKKAAAETKKLADAERDRMANRPLQDLARKEQAEREHNKINEDIDAAEKKRMDGRELQARAVWEEYERAHNAANEAIAKDDQKLMEGLQADWQRTVDQMGQSLADALMTGGKNLAGYLQGLFRTLVLRPVLMPAATAASAFLTGPAGAASGGGVLGGTGNIGSIGSLLGGIGGFGASAGAGFSATLGGAGIGDLLAGAGAALGQGTMAGASAGLGLGVGAIAPYAIAAVGAYMLGKKLFGRKLQDTGLQGTFDASGDFSGNAYQFYKGGWLRKDKTKRSELDPALESTLDAGAMAMSATVRHYAEVLGLPAEAIKGYSQQIKLSLKGLGDKEIEAVITKAIADFGEGMAGRFGAALSAFQKAGETMADTLTRLAGLQTFSNTLAEMGGVFERVARLGIDAREGLIEMAGGMDAMAKKALQFVQDYYSRDEIAGLKAGEIKDALAAVGITKDVNSREEFRALMDSLDVNTDTGREQLVAMLDMAQAFTGVADFLAETGRTLSAAAAGAPAGNGATALFAAGGAADQVLAINNVGYWTQAVYDAIKEQTGIIAAQRPPASAPLPEYYPPPEVNNGWNWGAESN